MYIYIYAYAVAHIPITSAARLEVSSVWMPLVSLKSNGTQHQTSCCNNPAQPPSMRLVMYKICTAYVGSHLANSLL